MSETSIKASLNHDICEHMGGIFYLFPWQFNDFVIFLLQAFNHAA